MQHALDPAGNAADARRPQYRRSGWAQLRQAVCCALAVLCGAGRLGGVEIAASGLSFPFFDEAGKLTHKVIARQGTMTGGVQHLQAIEIEYYADGDPTRVVQRLIAEEATWNEKAGVLDGRGAITVETEQNRLTGDGFRLELTRSQLNIHRNFAMTNPEVALTSDRAVVDLVLERDGNDVYLRDVKRCEAIGNLRVKVQPTATRKYDFDEARSERAVYVGATHTIEIPQETELRQKGVRSGRSTHFSIKLDPKTRPAEKLKR